MNPKMHPPGIAQQKSHDSAMSHWASSGVYIYIYICRNMREYVDFLSQNCSGSFRVRSELKFHHHAVDILL